MALLRCRGRAACGFGVCKACCYEGWGRCCRARLQPDCGAAWHASSIACITFKLLQFLLPNLPVLLAGPVGSGIAGLVAWAVPPRWQEPGRPPPRRGIAGLVAWAVPPRWQEPGRPPPRRGIAGLVAWAALAAQSVVWDVVGRFNVASGGGCRARLHRRPTITFHGCYCGVG